MATTECEDLIPSLCGGRMKPYIPSDCDDDEDEDENEVIWPVRE